MSLIRPFAGLRPRQPHANEVIAPPYDVLNTVEAREQAQGHPWSFLHISKPEIDLEPDVDPYDPRVYRQGAENLEKMLDSDILFRDERPYYYLYRLIMGSHVQTGLVAVASVPEYNHNRIRKHEFTRPDKEDDRVRHIDSLNTQTGPVFLTYRHSEAVDSIASKVCNEIPEYDLTVDDGVRHTLWVIRDTQAIENLTRLFDAMDNLYIADGHHRSAAASRVAAIREKSKLKGNNHDYFLVALFPDNQTQIMDYNRVVKDLNGLSEQAFLDAIRDNFDLEPSSRPVKPTRPNQFGMYLSGQWCRLTIRPKLIPRDDPVGRLDISLLHNHLVEPVLGISNPRQDKRVDFVGGIRGLPELERRVDSGEMAVAFSLYPTSLQDLMAVADANKTMPPKSTWFEPKLADGLISHVLD